MAGGPMNKAVIMTKNRDVVNHSHHSHPIATPLNKSIIKYISFMSLPGVQIQMCYLMIILFKYSLALSGRVCLFTKYKISMLTKNKNEFIFVCDND